MSVLLTAGISIFLSATGLAREAIELESGYDGDGWFHYRLRTLEDPFLAGVQFGQLLPVPFPDYQTNTVPDDWTNFFSNEQWSGIIFDATNAQPRINEISFSVKSGSTHFKRKPYGFKTKVYFTFADQYKGGLGGYLNLDCLIPCAPEEADGSPPTLVYRQELVPDVKIDRLVLTNQNIYGVTFSWAEPSTVELQGSFDMTSWTNIARFFGDPPQTTWTTNISLNQYGRFFRLSLVSNSHVTNDPHSGLSAAISDNGLAQLAKILNSAH